MEDTKPDAPNRQQKVSGFGGFLKENSLIIGGILIVCLVLVATCSPPSPPPEHGSGSSNVQSDTVTVIDSIVIGPTLPILARRLGNLEVYEIYMFTVESRSILSENEDRYINYTWVIPGRLIYGVDLSSLPDSCVRVVGDTLVQVYVNSVFICSREIMFDAVRIIEGSSEDAAPAFIMQQLVNSQERALQMLEDKAEEYGAIDAAKENAETAIAAIYASVGYETEVIWSDEQAPPSARDVESRIR